MYKTRPIISLLFFAIILWGCGKGNHTVKPKTVDSTFSDTTFSNWEILGKDYPATATYFTFNQVPGTVYFVADDGLATNPAQEIIVWFNKRPTVNGVYHVRAYENIPTDTTCTIAVYYNSGSNAFTSGNSGIVKVTVSKGKVTAYFSNVNVGGTNLKTNVSGYLIEQ